MWSEMLDSRGVGRAANPARRVYRLCERTLDKEGQVTLMPHYTQDGRTTTLPLAAFDESAVNGLYCDHATHEQFHTEFKTGRDLSRLPSGKFDTNYLVCALAAVAMNILRGIVFPKGRAATPSAQALAEVIRQAVLSESLQAPPGVSKITALLP